MAKLAALGGTPVITEQFAFYNSLGEEEYQAVNKVMRSGVLSKFYGSWCEDFFGGPAVKALESDWSKRFAVKHAVTVNSATSGLFAALGAIGVGPGDEVIVPPYTMSATAMAPLIYGAIPVFADIEEQTYCIDPAQVVKNIGPRTKAILAVNLFGHPAKLKELRAIADRHGIKLIEDNAQGPLAMENGRYAGTIGHIGVFSLNYHKHIHTGEGGVCVTDDDGLALRLQLIRNHGENAAEPLELADLTNIIGFNYRMTELSAAVGVEQLKKIDYHVDKRKKYADHLNEVAAGLPGIKGPVTRNDCRHVYYVWAFRFNQEYFGVSRETFAKALMAEGFACGIGYVKPLYLLPTFQKRIAIGSAGFPFTLSDRTYAKGLCPVVERMHEAELLVAEVCTYDLSNRQIDMLGEALLKVHGQKDELRELEKISERPQEGVLR